MGIISSLFSRFRRIDSIEARLIRLQESVGRIEARQAASGDSGEFCDQEFRVFSQWGEDGIIQYLVRHVPIERKIFVEFGVEHYSESNTRFLLTNNNWSGLVLDSDPNNIERIRNDEIYWRHNFKAELAFVNSDNINSILRLNGISGDIGLLSVDIDGNDYWVWRAIEGVNPRIVVVEYNSRFGPERAVTIPYDKEFSRGQAHHSQIYYGASLGALEYLGKQKGYVLVGCNSAGNNAFFVRKDCLVPELKPKTAREAFVDGSFRETRDNSGKLLFLSPEQEKEILEALPLVNIEE